MIHKSIILEVILITASKKVGRPKGKTKPKSQAELYKKSMEKLIEQGGTRLSTILHGEDVSALIRFRNAYGLPEKTSYAEIIRIFILLIDGKQFQINGGAISVKLERTQR